MRKKIRFFVVLITFLLLSLFFKIELDNFIMSTIYTVSSIMFSIGIGLVVSFNLYGIKNKSFVKIIRSNLNEVRNSYILYFAISTICYIADRYLREKHISAEFRISDNTQIDFCLSFFFLLVILYSMVYYISNFLALQKLNNDIFDTLNN
ncbi:MAG: hypothetical protein LBG80_19705 [Bacteroidales bacterium]|jgi:hypothetical protein|nr:hypothetical protein [Bacteroidales bacterium]